MGKKSGEGQRGWRRLGMVREAETAVGDERVGKWENRHLGLSGRDYTNS